MSQRIAGFKGEYLWELDIPEDHLCALAEAIPSERYGWRPADDSRSVSEVLVHIAAGNFALLDIVGVQAPVDVYPPVEGQGLERFLALVMRNHSLEKSLTAKADVVRMLRASLAAVRTAFTVASSEKLEEPGMFFGEPTTVRRVYLRMLAHMHEHMGQVVAYVRTMGMKAPWPDPLEMVRSSLSSAASSGDGGILGQRQDRP